jgi:hypothetical protein
MRSRRTRRCARVPSIGRLGGHARASPQRVGSTHAQTLPCALVHAYTGRGLRSTKVAALRKTQMALGRNVSHARLTSGARNRQSGRRQRTPSMNLHSQ